MNRDRVTINWQLTRKKARQKFGSNRNKVMRSETKRLSTRASVEDLISIREQQQEYRSHLSSTRIVLDWLRLYVLDNTSEERMGSPNFAMFIWEKRMEQENIERRLHSSNALIDSNRVSLNKMPLDLSPVRIHKHRILCVDDDVLGTTMRAEILKEHGFSVVVFHSPLEVTRCDLSTFSLAILDFEMPGLNGRELLLRIRAMGARFPIVLLTGCLAGLSHEDCVLFARCIDKSMPIQYLLDAIAEFLDPNQGPDYG